MGIRGATAGQTLTLPHFWTLTIILKIGRYPRHDGCRPGPKWIARVADAARAPNSWTIEHECLVIPVGPTGPGGFQTVSTRRHRKTTDRRNRHEEVCSDGGRPVGCCAGRKPHDERVRADDQDWRDRTADRSVRRVWQLCDQWREDCG